MPERTFSIRGKYFPVYYLFFKIHINIVGVIVAQKTKRNYCPGCKKETIWDYYEARGGFKHWKCRDCGEKETF